MRGLCRAQYRRGCRFQPFSVFIDGPAANDLPRRPTICVRWVRNACQFDAAQNDHALVPYFAMSFAFSGRTSRRMRTAATFLVALSITGASAWAQAVATGDEVPKGRHLAIMLCAGCHVVAPDQPYAPTQGTTAPPFLSIARRAGTTIDSLRNFLTTTHQGLDRQQGMPNPMLADFQIKAIAAYLLSLRK